MTAVDKFDISLVRKAVVALEANTFVEPQPEIYAEREAKLLGIDPTIPGVAIIPNDRKIPSVESFACVPE